MADRFELPLKVTPISYFSYFLNWHSVGVEKVLFFLGLNCDQCAPGYTQKAWRRYTKDDRLTHFFEFKHPHHISLYVCTIVFVLRT